MIALVRLALRRPYTFVVMAILILLIGPLAALRTPTDILPNINIPVIAAVWTYNGLSPEDMSGRIVYVYERQLASYVNDIQHIESVSLLGTGIIKIFFQPGVDIRTATAQVTSTSQTVLKYLPPGITPPLILNYNASTVPIIQLALSSPSLPEQSLFDFGQNFIRPSLATVAGTAVPSPYGGKIRQIQIDLDTQALQSKGLSAQDVVNALAAQNQITPAGTAKIGPFEYNIRLNNSPKLYQGLNDLPIRSVNGTTIYVRDVANARDGFPPQTNVVRVDGRRAVLMSILKSGSVSTLAIVAGVKQLLPKMQASLPPALKITAVGDQSLFVKAAVMGVIKEGITAACLTSLMILLFLGSWRSTLIIATSIPLAILSSVTALSALGQTLNIMTLGGLALAVGILVDDATVTIENINWHLEQGKPVEQSIMDGAHQIVTPAFVSLLCICIVFVPMFFLGGIAGYLFVPMAEAVVFAMIASFCLSRTLVPTLAAYLLKPHAPANDDEAPPRPRNPLARFQAGFARRFEAVRETYRQHLAAALSHRKAFVAGFLGVIALSLTLTPFLGRNFFPSVDSGAIYMHARAPIGTRIEETAALFDHIETTVREVIPADELTGVVDNIGLPISGANLAYSNTGSIGPEDGDVLITLTKDHRPTAGYVKQLRKALPRAYPGVTFSFLPADIISQILNFGAPAPLDMQVRGANAPANQAYALALLNRIRKIPGVADPRIQQAENYPELAVNIDRTRADQVGITEGDVSNTLGASLAGSLQVAPSFWLDLKTGVSYPIDAQTPQYKVDSLPRLQGLPVTGARAAAPQVLGALGVIDRASTPAVVTHYDVEPAYDVYATPQGRDLGAVADDVHKVLEATAKDLPKGSTVVLRGQVATMNKAFGGLLFGLLGAIVLIYLLIVVNFQSWLDPFIIITALPAAIAGILWMLFATGTTLSVPALTGAIMCMGVATANSILVVSFARDRLEAVGDPVVAAVEAGVSRFRPVLMTALAMIIGMSPMALGLGEGGEQNAPLGRAVIGGLLFATVATLFFVPVVFSLLHSAGPSRPQTANADHEALRRPRLRRLKLMAAIAAAAALTVVAVGTLTRVKAAAELRTWTAGQAVPTVSVVHPSVQAGLQHLILPGTIEAFFTAPIYARVNGYVQAWYHDIGDRVRAGQLLALIDTPELDEQLAKARADLASAKAARQVAQSTASRWAELLARDAVSKQEQEVTSGDLLTKTAAVKAAQAEVDRLVAETSFKRLTAPFDGLVTARRTDLGALINAGSGAAAGALFDVADVRKLRVYVRVPQNLSAPFKPGMTAELSVPEYPGRTFSATLIGSAQAVNGESGTVLVQLLEDNGAGELKPGAYAQMTFALPPPPGLVTLPATTLVFRREGLRVAVVGPDSRIVMKPVIIARDLGVYVEIASGVGPQDRVVNNPPDSLANGERVQVAGGADAPP